MFPILVGGCSFCRVFEDLLSLELDDGYPRDHWTATRCFVPFKVETLRKEMSDLRDALLHDNAWVEISIIERMNIRWTCNLLEGMGTCCHKQSTIN
jgi:hypothetical protein